MMEDGQLHGETAPHADRKSVRQPISKTLHQHHIRLFLLFTGQQTGSTLLLPVGVVTSHRKRFGGRTHRSGELEPSEGP